MKTKTEKIIIVVLIVAICSLASALIIDMYNSDKTKDITTRQSTDQITQEQTSATTDSNEQNQTQNTEPDELAILINDKNPLPDDWQADVVKVDNNHFVDRRAYDDLQKMFSDARTLGYKPMICSSYRTMEKQTKLFDAKVKSYEKEGKSKEEAEKLAAQWVAYPGTSEHQSGLALDIVTKENQILDESQLNSECQQWLMNNSYKYGFILRYPKDKTSITGKDFEPWHYRYVGKAVAKQIFEKGICLEEYVENN